MNNDINIHVYHHMPKKKVGGVFTIIVAASFCIGSLVEQNLKLNRKIDILKKELRELKEED